MARKNSKAQTPKSNSRTPKSKSQTPKSKAETPKSKVKKAKKEIKIAPRLRLEPRLTSSPLKGKKSKTSDSDESLFLPTKDTENSPVLDSQKSDTGGSYESRNEISNTVSLSAAEGNTSFQTESNTAETSENEEQFKTPVKSSKKGKKYAYRIYGGLEWSDRERMDLGTALQVHGFSDLKKLAECVKTKKEGDIEFFMRRRRNEASYNPFDKRIINRQGNKFNSLRQHHLATWPNIRKWRRLSFNQMMRYARNKDYSKPILTALCKKFYEEESEPTDPQGINVKLIYKYMMNSMEGEAPPQLPPKESALVLDILREVRSMPIAYDFEEERKFMQDFRTATKFRPFEVKDEFKKRIKKEPQEENMFPPNTVQVPEQVFMELSRHKRLTQSFSPMVTPVWMLQKEQEMLANYAAESNVYVD